MNNKQWFTMKNTNSPRMKEYTNVSLEWRHHTLSHVLHDISVFKTHLQWWINRMPTVGSNTVAIYRCLVAPIGGGGGGGGAQESENQLERTTEVHTIRQLYLMSILIVYLSREYRSRNLPVTAVIYHVSEISTVLHKDILQYPQSNWITMNTDNYWQMNTGW